MYKHQKSNNKALFPLYYFPSHLHEQQSSSAWEEALFYIVNLFSYYWKATCLEIKMINYQKVTIDFISVQTLKALRKKIYRTEHLSRRHEKISGFKL